MKTIEDPWLGKREVDDSALGLIKDQHRLLCAFRDDGRKPSDHLLEDIKVYEYIMEHPEGEKMAGLYFSVMNKLRESKGYGASKMEAAMALGWFQ